MKIQLWDIDIIQHWIKFIMEVIPNVYEHTRAGIYYIMKFIREPVPEPYLKVSHKCLQ